MRWGRMVGSVWVLVEARCSGSPTCVPSAVEEWVCWGGALFEDCSLFDGVGSLSMGASVVVWSGLRAREGLAEHGFCVVCSKVAVWGRVEATLLCQRGESLCAVGYAGLRHVG